MKQKLFFIFFFVFASFIAFSQTPIHVADLSFKMKSNTTEEFYYSFAEGDVMVMDFELKKGKNVDIEIVELPNQTKIKQLTARISNYRINVTSTKVYLFKIANGLGNKVCSLSIKRIPKSQETMNFNTGWKWKTLYDTTYTQYREDSLVGHETVHYTETEKEVASKELSEVVLVDHIERIHSNARVLINDIPRAYVTINLPQNQYEKYREKRVIGWAYWICVGEKSNSFWNQNVSLIAKSAAKIAGISGVGALVVGGVTSMIIPSNGEDNVLWGIVANSEEKNSFMNGGQALCLRKGDGPGAFGKFTDKNTQGTYYIVMYNHNHFQSIKVNVKASAVVETITYKDVDYERTKTVPKYVQLTKTRRNISSSQVRVPMDEGR